MYINGIHIDDIRVVTVKHRGIIHVLVRNCYIDVFFTPPGSWMDRGGCIFVPDSLHAGIRSLTFDQFKEWISNADEIVDFTYLRERY